MVNRTEDESMCDSCTITGPPEDFQTCEACGWNLCEACIGGLDHDCDGELEPRPEVD